MVIVILGILAATALPRFVDLSAKAKENAAKGSLGSIRAAVAIRYASNAAYNNAVNPSTIESTMFHDGVIPSEPYGASGNIEIVTVVPAAAGSGWAYDSSTGRVWINHSAYTAY
jgi:MSHA pilin protein MshA